MFILRLMKILALSWQKIRRAERSKILRESTIRPTGILHFQRKRWDFSPKRRHSPLLSDAKLRLLFVLNAINGAQTLAYHRKKAWRICWVTFWKTRFLQFTQRQQTLKRYVIKVCFITNQFKTGYDLPKHSYIQSNYKTWRSGLHLLQTPLNGVTVI